MQYTIIKYFLFNIRDEHRFLELKMATELWNPIRESIINDLRLKQEDNKKALNEIANEIRKVKITGSSISIIGGVIALLGFLLILNKAAFSGIVLSIVGTIIALRGAFISVTATFGKFRRQKKIIKDCTKEALVIDKQLWEMVKKLAEKCCNLPGSNFNQQNLEDISIYAKNVFRATTYFGLFALGGVRITRSVSVVATQTIKIASTAFRAIGIAGIVISGLILPLDIIELVFNAYRLHYTKDSKAVSQLKNVITGLETHLDKVKKELREREHKMNITMMGEQEEINNFDITDLSTMKVIIIIFTINAHDVCQQKIESPVKIYKPNLIYNSIINNNAFLS